MTHRWPGNVPYLVDNLWEWQRWMRHPECPSRRHAIFALARCKLAEAHAVGDSKLHKVILFGSFKLCQLHNNLLDAKYHPDCRAITRRAIEILSELGMVTDGAWKPEAPSEIREDFGRLWMPGLLAGEVEEVARKSKEVGAFLQKILPAVTFWTTVRFVDENRSCLAN